MLRFGTWNSMGARGRAAGLSARVADFRMAVPRPPMASTLPAGTSYRQQRLTVS